jgi:integrase/recombinase XerD
MAKRNISGHSARVGHAHDLLKEGKSLPQIMVAGGWKSTNIVLRYIENSNLVLHS